jgi:hypothetical protein
MTADAVFVPDGGTFMATDLAVGPWSPGTLHGGAPAALMVHALRDQPADPRLRLARITYEFMRPVPMGPLTVGVEVVRPGRRVTLLDAVLHGPDQTEVTRARALLLRPSELGGSLLGTPPFPGPDAGEQRDWHNPPTPTFATDAMEIRFVEGEFREPGPSTAWFRLRHPLVAGVPTRPLELLAAVSDFGNGIASELSWDDHVFINPDLTVYVEREPAGEWVALQSQTRLGTGSVAIAESVLWDQRGRIGRATQSLLVSRR